MVAHLTTYHAMAVNLVPVTEPLDVHDARSRAIRACKPINGEY